MLPDVMARPFLFYFISYFPLAAVSDTSFVLGCDLRICNYHLSRHIIRRFVCLFALS